MTRARSITAVACIGMALVACGGVDRDGTRDNIIESFETDVGLELDESCVDGVLDGYSDDELESIDDAMNANEMTEQAQEFALEIFECAPGS